MSRLREADPAEAKGLLCRGAGGLADDQLRLELNAVRKVFIR